MLKKFISVFLCTVIFTVNVIFMPYATTVYASDLAGNVVKSISFDNVVKMVKSLYKVGYNVATTGSGDGAASSKALDSIWGEDSAVNKWLQTKLFPFMDASGNIDLTNPDSPITYDKDKQLVEFNPTFTTELNQQLQDNIHVLDGCYLFEPANSNKSALVPKIKANFIKYYSDKSIKSYVQSSTFNTDLAYKFENYACVVFNPVYISKNNFDWCFPYFVRKSSSGFDTSLFLYLSGGYLMQYNKNTDKSDKTELLKYKIDELDGKLYSYTGYSDKYVLDLIKSSMPYAYGSPFRIFYSLQDVKNYLNKGRIYVPQLPSGGFKINIKYINNSVNYPDVKVNLDSLVGKVEADVQANLDLALKNYLDHLADFTDGGGGTTNPTPTPSGGGSGGDFGDGTTPTPKPDFTDGSLTDTNTLLQKILDKLTEFSANHDKLAKTITDYIEKNNGKLEEILIAIQALSDGKTETEQNGCKYDFTALSKYLTDLWNNSDKKFDEMVKLLEENNKYQQKLVDSLNEIKALLIADTVMDFFKDRSQETAEKAKDKFPTSIPWDISLVLNSMSAEPKNPKFSLPIKIESFKINETIDIDLSTDEWEKLAKTCRYILSVTFILFLIHLSRKLFSSGGDD